MVKTFPNKASTKLSKSQLYKVTKSRWFDHWISGVALKISLLLKKNVLKPLAEVFWYHKGQQQQHQQQMLVLKCIGSNSVGNFKQRNEKYHEDCWFSKRFFNFFHFETKEHRGRFLGMLLAVSLLENMLAGKDAKIAGWWSSYPSRGRNN